MVINALIGAVSTLVLFFLLNGIKKTDRRLIKRKVLWRLFPMLRYLYWLPELQWQQLELCLELFLPIDYCHSLAIFWEEELAVLVSDTVAVLVQLIHPARDQRSKRTDHIQTFILNNEPFSLVKRNWIYSNSPLYFRKSENKTRSDIFDTFDVNGSIVEVYNPAHHRKTESGTAIFSWQNFLNF